MMSRAVEKLYKEAYARGYVIGFIYGYAIGILRSVENIAKNMLNMGYSHEQIAKALNLPLDRIREIEAACKND